MSEFTDEELAVLADGKYTAEQAMEAIGMSLTGVNSDTGTIQFASAEEARKFAELLFEGDEVPDEVRSFFGGSDD